MNLDQFIQRTQKFEERLRSPREFFALKATDYLLTARRIARETMITLRPPDSDPVQWSKRVDEVADSVTAALLRSQDGMVFSIRPKRDDGSLPGKDQRSPVQAITFDDVMQWIQDGLDGKPGGKNLTIEDEASLQTEKGRKARATIIMKAYYGLEPNDAWSRLRGHIQRWVRREDALKPDEFMLAIAAAWKANFVPIVEREMSAWVSVIF